MKLHSWATIPYADLKYFPPSMRRTFWQYSRRYFGMGVTVDKELAHKMLESALSAKWGLLVRSLRNYHAKNYRRIFLDLAGLANEGHPVAQYLFAAAHLKQRPRLPLGEFRSYIVDMLKSSADAGFSPAMYKLAMFWYRNPPGFSPVEEHARAMLRKAASLGHAKSIAYIGLNDLRPFHTAVVCVGLNVKPSPMAVFDEQQPMTWLHAFVILHGWRKEKHDPKKQDQKYIIENYCFIAPQSATDEELEIFRDIVYNNGKNSAKWLEKNEQYLTEEIHDY